MHSHTCTLPHLHTTHIHILVCELTTPTCTHQTHTTHTHLSQLRLEEKQRAKRRKREAAAAKAAEAAANGDHEEAARLEKEATYTPRWFQKEYDPLSNTMMHVYKGGYWEQKLRGDWGGLPDLFGCFVCKLGALGSYFILYSNLLLFGLSTLQFPWLCVVWNCQKYKYIYAGMCLHELWLKS